MRQRGNPDAVRRAAFVLERRAEGALLREIAVELGVSDSRVRQLLARAERDRRKAALHGGLSPRAEKIIRLECGSFDPLRVADVLTRSGLERQPNCGRATISEIEEWLAGSGHALKD